MRDPAIHTMTRLALLIATAGYVGYAPFAPGTVGSLAGLVIYVVIRMSGLPGLEIGVIAFLLAAGVWAALVAERHFGGIDPGPVVIDEVAGMLITLAFIPVGRAGVLAGFLLFRLFDILKPFPAAQLERLHGGFGIMADDVMAGIYANLSVRLVLWIFPAWSL